MEIAIPYQPITSIMTANHKDFFDNPTPFTSFFFKINPLTICTITNNTPYINGTYTEVLDIPKLLERVDI